LRRQFLDIGTGLPTDKTIYQIAAPLASGAGVGRKSG
jgi:S-adenosyl methyltransferase